MIQASMLAVTVAMHVRRTASDQGLDRAQLICLLRLPPSRKDILRVARTRGYQPPRPRTLGIYDTRRY